jgi:hypothetical protein
MISLGKEERLQTQHNMKLLEGASGDLALL